MEGSGGNSLHVAINAHLLSGEASYRSAGVHQYIRHLLRHLGEADRRLRLTAMLGGGPAANMAVGLARSRWPTSRAPVRALWEQSVQPWVLHQIGADLVHGPVFTAPLLSPCPAVITIHDLSFIRFPRLFRPANRVYLTLMTRLSAERARRLIAVSTHTAIESTQLLGIPRERIDVIYHGVDPDFRPLPAEEIAAFRERRGLPERFVLCVGTLEPRKNHAKLVEAFAHMRDGGVKLILAGGRGWLYDDVAGKVESLGLRDAVAFPGYVENSELPLWYNAATIVAYPSLYEGFGLPVLEAQACGTPVLTSNVSSLPEAAGDAAMLVDPNNVEALAAGLHRLLTDELLRRELRERGLAHASQFTWSHAACQTVQTYRQAVADGSP